MTIVLDEDYNDVRILEDCRTFWLDGVAEEWKNDKENGGATEPDPTYAQEWERIVAILVQLGHSADAFPAPWQSEEEET
jgi:hypothetical protein